MSSALSVARGMYGAAAAVAPRAGQRRDARDRAEGDRRPRRGAGRRRRAGERRLRGGDVARQRAGSHPRGSSTPPSLDRVVAQARDQVLVADGVLAAPRLVREARVERSRAASRARARRPSPAEGRGAGRRPARCGSGTGRSRRAAPPSAVPRGSAATGAARSTSGSSPRTTTAARAATSSGSTPATVRVAMPTPRRPPSRRSCGRAARPERVHHPVGHRAALQHAHRAEVEYGRTDSGPCRSIAAGDAAAATLERLVPARLAELPGALPPVRTSG